MKSHWNGEVATSDYGKALIETFGITPKGDVRVHKTVFKRLQYLEGECKGWNAWRND